MTFAADGSLIEVERDVSPESLPLPVFAATLQPRRGGKVGKIKSVTRGGVVTVYETTITRRSFRHEIAFGSDGMRRPAD
jgi:hypothetical protein